MLRSQLIHVFTTCIEVEWLVRVFAGVADASIYSGWTCQSKTQAVHPLELFYGGQTLM